MFENIRKITCVKSVTITQHYSTLLRKVRNSIGGVAEGQFLTGVNTTLL